MLQVAHQGRHRRLTEFTHPPGQVGDLHGTGVGDADPFDLGRPRRLAEPGAVALGTDGEGGGPIDERPDVRLERVRILGEERLLHLGDQTLVGDVDLVHPDLGGLLVEEVAQLALGVVADGLVRIDESRLGERAHHPAVGLVTRNGDGPIVERQGIVVELREVDVRYRAPALAMRAHAAGTGEADLHGPGLAAFDRDRTTRRDRGHVERVGIGGADVRLPEPAEQDAQHGVGVGGGADRRARVAAHPFLVDGDHRRQPFEDVDVGPRHRRHEALHEGAVGLVDQPLRLGGDRVEHQRALARAGDAGEHRQPAFGYLDVDVLEIVLARSGDPDEFVAVGDVHPVTLVRPEDSDLYPAGPPRASLSSASSERMRTWPTSEPAHRPNPATS